jgi:hypothetical protein
MYVLEPPVQFYQNIDSHCRAGAVSWCEQPSASPKPRPAHVGAGEIKANVLHISRGQAVARSMRADARRQLNRLVRALRNGPKSREWRSH